MELRFRCEMGLGWMYIWGSCDHAGIGSIRLGVLWCEKREENLRWDCGGNDAFLSCMLCEFVGFFCGDDSGFV